MNFESFSNLIQTNVPVGTALRNPGKGTSTILSYSKQGIYYLRGKSKINLPFKDLFEAFKHFKGSRVSSTDLKILWLRKKIKKAPK